MAHLHPEELRPAGLARREGRTRRRAGLLVRGRRRDVGAERQHHRRQRADHRVALAGAVCSATEHVLAYRCSRDYP